MDTDIDVIDLSHVVEDGMTTYPGLPGPEITDHLSHEDSHGLYAPGTEFQIGRISMVANTGTYLDTPFHRFGDGADLAGVPLSGLVDLDGMVIRAERRAICTADLSRYRDVIPGRAVLVHTGWDRHWGTSRYADASHPYLTAEATRWLAALRPAVVGIDSVNIDDMADLSRPAHTGLLAAGIPIIEHMTGLDRLPDRHFRFHGAPIAVAGMGTFPIRAYALLGHRN
jgi:kynurenine formamidase